MAFLPLPAPLSPGSFLLAKPGSTPSAATAAARSADTARLWGVLLQKAPPSPVVEVLLLGSWGSVHSVYFYLHWNAARSRRESTKMSWKWKHLSVRFNVPFWLRIAGAHVAPMRVLKIQFIIAAVVNFLYTITPLSTHGIIQGVLLKCTRTEMSSLLWWVFLRLMGSEQQVLATLPGGSDGLSRLCCS